MKITQTNPLDNTENTMEIDVTQDQLNRIASRTELIQFIVPNLTTVEREFLRSGIIFE